MRSLRFTDYLAIYAAILSTSVFLWNILQSRPRVVIDLLPGLDDFAANPRNWCVCHYQERLVA